jgi:oligopeptide transport system substrate-binding protein
MEMEAGQGRMKLQCHLTGGRLILLLALAILAGCGRSGTDTAFDPGNASPDRILQRGNGPDPDSLDPQKAQATEAHTVLRDLCEGLTTLDKEARPAPGVAKEWTVSADGLTYTFTLRNDARWSNGDPVAGADFVAGLRRLVDPNTASGYANVIDVIHNARDILGGKKSSTELGISAPNDQIVVISLDHPAPYLPGLLSHPSTCPVHRPTFARYGEGFSRPGVMISNGAYALAERTPGQQITLVRNRFYWRNSGTYFDVVKYLQISDANAEFLRYRSGDLDISDSIPRAQADHVRELLPGQLHVSPQLGVYYYGFNLNRAPFRDNPNLRRALSLAIDRKQIASTILRIGELPAYGWVPNGVNNYESQSYEGSDLEDEARKREAQRLYRLAGYSASHPLQFELRYNQGEVHTHLAVVISEMWRRLLGVNAQPTAVEFRVLIDEVEHGDVDVFRSSWIGDYNDALSFLQVFRSNSGINLPHYQNRNYDALLDSAAAEADPLRRRELLQQAERQLLNDTAVIPLYFYVSKHLVSPRIAGWYQNIMNVTYSKDLSLNK